MLTRSLTWISSLALGAGIGRWIATGGPWLLIIVYGTMSLPVIMLSYYWGHRHGRDDMRAEVVAKFNAIPRTRV